MTEWSFDPNDDSNSECSNCGRIRISLCLNGKHRCEKCDYSPEEGRVVTDDEIDGLEEGGAMDNPSLIMKPQGKAIARIQIEMDVKGQAVMKAIAIDPFGREGVLSPFMTAQLMSKVLAQVIDVVATAAAKKFVEEAGNNGSKETIS